MHGMAKPSGDPILLDPSTISHFVVDWDETVTTLDTMHLLGAAAYEYQDEKLKQEQSQGQPEPSNDKDKDSDDEGFQPRWDYFVREFLNDYTRYSRAFQPDPARSLLQQEFDFLNGLRPIEYKSAQRVEQAGLFKGIQPVHLQNQVPKVMFRNGWWDLVKQIHGPPSSLPSNKNKNKNNNDEEEEGKVDNEGIQKHYPSIVIVSVNWSADLINMVLDAHFPGHNIRVFSNHIDWTSGKLIKNNENKEEEEEEEKEKEKKEKDNVNYKSTSTTKATKATNTNSNTTKAASSPAQSLASFGDIRTAADKKKIIQLLKQEARQSNPNVSRQLWYFGDSSTDTMALIEADKGIVMAKKKTFDRLSKELSVQGLSFISDWTFIKVKPENPL